MIFEAGFGLALKVELMTANCEVNVVDEGRRHQNGGQLDALRVELENNLKDKKFLLNLQPSTNLKKLNIRSYSGTSFPKWLGDSSYSNVIVLCISDCNYCFSLPPFGQLPSLKELVIKSMKMVKTVGEEFYCNDGGSLSFQPFQLLESIEFEEMSEWEEWLQFEGEGSKFPFPCLKRLSLSKCPKLRGNLPKHLPSLTEISIKECNQLAIESCHLHWNTSIESVKVSEVGEGLLSLLDNFSYRELSIEKCDSLSCLPRMILAANCLQKLTLGNIPTLISFPAEGFPTSLKTVSYSNASLLCLIFFISGFGEEDVVNTLLKEQLLPSSLQHLHLRLLEGKGLQHLTSLTRLDIIRCESLESLPEDQLPTSLELLKISCCPLLEARYQSRKGKHWSKIAHIPAIKTNDEVII
ncbi:putative disease resistance protein [Glycine soja]